MWAIHSDGLLFLIKDKTLQLRFLNYHLQVVHVIKHFTEILKTKEKYDSGNGKIRTSENPLLHKSNENISKNCQN